MYLWDEKFKENKKKYAYQCVLASLVVFILLLFLDAKEHSAIISVLGASSFVVYTMPERVSSMPRFLIGGYVMGIFSHPLFVYGTFGALAVG